MTASQYSLMARRHWEQFRPRELAAMQDPTGFFTAKGQELQNAVITAQEALEETLEPATGYPARVCQLNQIRATAEQQVMAQLLPPPEDDEDPDLPPSPISAELTAIRQDLQAL